LHRGLPILPTIGGWGGKRKEVRLVGEKESFRGGERKEKKLIESLSEVKRKNDAEAED